MKLEKYETRALTEVIQKIKTKNDEVKDYPGDGLTNYDICFNRNQFAVLDKVLSSLEFSYHLFER